MTFRIPAQMIEHPVESFIGAALLMVLLVGASDGGTSQKPVVNQAVSACATAACTIVKPV